MKTILITGASMGLGAEFARELATRSGQTPVTLLLVARSAEKLEALRHELENTTTRIVTIPQDLAKTGAAETLYQTVTKQGFQVDTLINNAGFGDYGPFLDADLKREEEMVLLNVLTLTQLSKLFGREMKERGHGQIMNVSSTAAFQPGPLMAVYFATKSYVLSLTQALRSELKNSGVHVTTLCPGPTATEFQATSALTQSNSNFFEKTPLAPARSVVRFGLKALERDQAVAIHGFANRLVAFLTRLVPQAFTIEVTRRLMKPMGQP